MNRILSELFKVSGGPVKTSGSLFSSLGGIRGVFNMISKGSGQVNQAMNIINQLSNLNQKGSFQQLLSSLGNMNGNKVKPETAKKIESLPQQKTSNSANTLKQSEAPTSFYEVLNSPAMLQIVKEVVVNKKKRRR